MDKLIEAARERATSYGRDMRELTPEDIKAKVEEGTREAYYNGFRDYHGPNGDPQYIPSESPPQL